MCSWKTPSDRPSPLLAPVASSSAVLVNLRENKETTQLKRLNEVG